MKLTGRTILITGGTSGIGFELAKQLIEQRNTVLITGRDAQRLAATKSKLAVHTYLCDAANPTDIEKLQRSLAVDFPNLDTLINNAGIMRNLDLNQLHELTDVTLEVAVDLSGPIQMVQAFLPQLKARPDALIVNVSSGLAFVPFPLSPVYSAAKAGVHAYSGACKWVEKDIGDCPARCVRNCGSTNRKARRIGGYGQWKALPRRAGTAHTSLIRK
jgi:uncharacterized oxidoreductase